MFESVVTWNNDIMDAVGTSTPEFIESSVAIIFSLYSSVFNHIALVAEQQQKCMNDEDVSPKSKSLFLCGSGHC